MGDSASCEQRTVGFDELLALLGGALSFLLCSICALQVVDLAAVIFQQPDVLFEALGSQAEFFDQPHGPSASQPQALLAAWRSAFLAFLLVAVR